MKRAFALGALLLGGCSLLSEFGDECSSNDDCRAPLVCVENLCVRPGDGAGGAGGSGGVPGDVGPGGAGGGLTPDTGPTDAEIDLDAAPPDGETPDAAVDMGVPTVMLDEVCHTLHGASPEDALDPTKTVLLGVLMPNTGGLGALGPSISRAAYLAVDEINQAGGIGDGRQLALLDCDTATNPEKAVEAAQRLVDLGVPAIIGAAASSSTIKVFNEVARPAGVVMISPSSTTPAISDLPDDDLLWRTAPSDAIQGAAIAAFLEAQNIRKVAVINRDDVYGQGLREALQDARCERVTCDEDTYLTRSYPAEGATADDFFNIILDLQEFEPQQVVLIAFVEDGVQFLDRAARAPGLRQFILTDGAKKIDLVDRTSDEAEPLLRELFGTAPASPAGDNYLDFERRYSGKWQGALPDVFNAHAYDAAYLLGYAVGALGDEIPTGPAIAAQLKRLSEGPEIDAGGGDWNRGVNLLRQSAEATIDFRGASGELDFNAKGEAPGDIEGWRFDIDASRIRSLGIIYTADGMFIPPDLGPDDMPDAGMPDAGDADAGR